MRQQVLDSRKATSRAQSDGAIVLGLLNAVEKGGVTQRSLSRELGIAVGLVNIYIKRCINTGLIKVQEIPHRRYAYYVTPQGFVEKSRLITTHFISSFEFFRRARAACEDSLLKAVAAEQGRIALLGANELAEIAVVVAMDIGLQIVAIVDPVLKKPRFVGAPVIANVAAVAQIADAALVTSLANPQATFESAAEVLVRERVYIPALLFPVASSGGMRR